MRGNCRQPLIPLLETLTQQLPIHPYEEKVQWANPNMRFVIFIQKQTVRRYVTFQAPVFALGCHGEKNSHSTDDDRKYSFHFHIEIYIIAIKFRTIY